MTTTPAGSNSTRTAFQPGPVVPESAEVRRAEVAGDDAFRFYRWAAQVRAMPDVGASAKVVADALAHFANHRTGRCCPSRKALALAVGVKEPKSLRGPLAELQTAGLIEVQAGHGRTVSSYRLLVPEGLDRDPQRGRDEPLRGVETNPSEGSRRTPVTTKRTTERTNNSTAAAGSSGLDRDAETARAICADLAALVEEETGGAPTWGPKAVRGMAAILASHDGYDDVVRARVEYALAVDFWRDAISDSLERFVGGFDDIGKQMLTPSRSEKEPRCARCGDGDDHYLCPSCEADLDEVLTLWKETGEC